MQRLVHFSGTLGFGVVLYADENAATTLSCGVKPARGHPGKVVFK